MECADTLLWIASYLSKRDLVAVSGVSRLCRKVVTDAYISYEERQYLVWPCVKEDYVELAPPSQVLALGLLGSEQRLLVLIRSGTETSSLDELECYLYTQMLNSDGTLSEYQKEMPICFAYPTSCCRFQGNRFLTCTTREGDLHVFDCLVEAMIELPFGIDGFYPSPDGERFLVDYDRHAYMCSTTAHVACWWEMRHITSKGAVEGPYSGGPHTAQSSLMQAQLRAHICPLQPLSNGRSAAAVATPTTSSSLVSSPSSPSPPPPLQFFLGASSVAWHVFWVGSSTALYANEDGVFLLTPNPTEHRLDAEELPSLSPLCVCLVDSNCGDVYASQSEVHDEYAVMNLRETHLVTVDYYPQRAVEVRTVDLSRIVPARVVVRAVCIAVSRCTYLVYLQHLSQDRVLLLSADLTLTRWITVGRPSCFVLWRQQASLVTANLPDDVGGVSHPLVEAVEGGLGCVYTFGMQLPAASSTATVDPFVSAVKVRSSAEEEGGGAAGSHMRPAGPQGFNGVEALSWIACGVVSASLLWTLTALCYNGWWLHLQLLFWGKIA